MKKIVLRTVVLLVALGVAMLTFLYGCGDAGREYAYDYSDSAPAGGARRHAPGPPGDMAALEGEAFYFHACDATGSFESSESRPALPSYAEPGEELWVIAKPMEQVGAPAEPDPDVPGCGGLVCKPPSASEEDKEVPLPLKHTDVDAAISAYIASVTVKQQFHNPYDEKIEAVYVFPLPQNAAVSEFVMSIGERRIRGIIREKEEAELLYQQARSQGYVASLLTQQRPNIFTQKVANIEPGKAIDVDITYFNTLTYSDGWYQFVFPMVVGPRFNPTGSTDGVGAVARGAGGLSGQSTEVQYLKPGERIGHDISLSLKIDAGVSVEEVVSPSHYIETTNVPASEVNVKLSPRDVIPNKDFVLAYRVAGDVPKASMLTHRDERGGYFTLMLYPPREISMIERSPIEMVFVIDCSGSMRGEPMSLAKKAMRHALHNLQPSDSFQIIRFSNDSSTLGRRPLPATDDNVRRGLRYVDNLDTGGGTMMIRGIRAALDFPHDSERTRYVTFMTDGYIGNEAEILGEIEKRLGPSRIFSFGIGSSPNRYLLERMAKVGRGVVAYVGLNDRPQDVIDLFIERTSHPALADLHIDWGGLAVSDVYPHRTPDLFVGRPVILTGRFDGDPSGATIVRVTGRAGGRDVEIPLSVDLDDSVTTHSALANVWARMKIADLADSMNTGPYAEQDLQITQLALDYGLMSAYTAFIAVDSSRRTDGDHGTTVHVAVPVPDGVRYDTTVSDPSNRQSARGLDEGASEYAPGSGG